MDIRRNLLVEAGRGVYDQPLPVWYEVLRQARHYGEPVWDVSTAHAEHGDWTFVYLRVAHYLGVPFSHVLDRIAAGEDVWVFDALLAEQAEREAAKTLATPNPTLTPSA